MRICGESESSVSEASVLDGGTEATGLQDLDQELEKAINSLAPNIIDLKTLKPGKPAFEVAGRKLPGKQGGLEEPSGSNSVQEIHTEELKAPKKQKVKTAKKAYELSSLQKECEARYTQALKQSNRAKQIKDRKKQLSQSKNAVKRRFKSLRDRYVRLARPLRERLQTKIDEFKEEATKELKVVKKKSARSLSILFNSTDAENITESDNFFRKGAVNRSRPLVSSVQASVQRATIEKTAKTLIREVTTDLSNLIFTFGEEILDARKEKLVKYIVNCEGVENPNFKEIADLVENYQTKIKFDISDSRITCFEWQENLIQLQHLLSGRGGRTTDYRAQNIKDEDLQNLLIDPFLKNFEEFIEKVKVKPSILVGHQD